MESISVPVGVVSLLAQFLQVYFQVFLSLQRYAVEYGWIRALLLQIALRPGKNVIERVKTHVIEADKSSADEALAITRSYAASFNMIGVAGAIVAQIAITAISLNNIEVTHWTAMAAFVVSLVAGSLSVYFACLIQVQLSSLHGAAEVKDWLTTPKVRCTWVEVQPSEGATSQNTESRKMPQAYIGSMPSFNSALMLILPAHLLNWSVAALLVGIGIYYGLVFTRNLGILNGSNANLAVLIVYVVFTTEALMTLLMAALGKSMEKTLRAREDVEFYLYAMNYRLHDTVQSNRLSELAQEEGQNKATRLAVRDLFSSPYSPLKKEQKSSTDFPTHLLNEYEFHAQRLAEAEQAPNTRHGNAQQSDETKPDQNALIAALERSTLALQASIEANGSILDYLKSRQT